jgi:hypothetical protein
MIHHVSQSSRATAFATAGAIALASGAVYACLFNYLQFLPFRVLSMRLSSPEGRKQFFGNMISVRFWKSSIRNCLRYHWRQLTNAPRALKGSKAPDATLITIDGIKKSLYHDYLTAVSLDPWILVMGSYS